MNLEREFSEMREREQAAADGEVMSRRALLRKVGWVIPAIAILPLNPVYGQAGGFISPGPNDRVDPQVTAPSVSGSGSPSSDGGRREWAWTRGAGQSQQNNRGAR